MTLRLLLVLSFLLGAARVGAAATPGPLKCPGCDVILVLIDVWRADELKTGGARASIMPYADELAARGVVFSNAFAPTPVTGASGLSIDTGLEPWHHGYYQPARDQARKLQWFRSGKVLPAVLSRHGYGVFGMNLDAAGLDLDPSSRRELGPAAPPYARKPWKERDPKEKEPFFLQIRAALHDPYFPRLDDIRHFDSSIKPSDYPSEDDVKECEAAALLSRTTPASLETDQPDPLSTRPDERADFAHVLGLADPARRLAALRALRPSKSLYRLSSACYWSFFSSVTIATARLLYDARAREVDAELKAVMQELEAGGYLRHALVILTSQHGEEFLDHGKVTHALQLYDESLHVPMIMLFPGSQEGRLATGMARSADVMPTILDALGFKIPGGLDGTSLLPCVSGPCEGRHAAGYWINGFSLRDERWTYLRPPGAADRLFDRQADPKERADLAEREPETAARMKALLAKEFARMRDDAGAYPDDAGKDLRRQIQKRGYW